MALQVWLHGKDLINRGLCSNNASWVGSATYVDGKLGKCYSCTSSHYIDYTYNFASTDKFTIAFWIYIPTSLSTCNQWETVFNLPGYSISWASYNNLKIYNNSSNQLWWLGGDIFYDKWVHLTIAHNADTITLYINGDHYNTANSVSSPISSGTMHVGNGITDAHGPVKFNDIRLYNHCLSPKEVKEISKGLVLHYPLNDAYVEGTTNLVTSITKGGQTTVNGYEVTTSGVSKDTYFTLNLSEKIVAGNTYTISCRNNFDTGLYWDFPIGSQANQTLIWRITPGYSSYTFVANSGNSYWDKNTCFMDDLSGTARNAGKSFKMWDWQIEKKDHATPFVIGTRNETIVYDCSGYQNNGIVSGNITLSVDSPRYIGSYKFIPNAMISTPGIVNFDKCTYSVWCKDPNMSYKIVFCDGTSKVAFGESSGFLCSCGSNSQNKFTKNNWKNSDWNHVVVVRDGSTYKMYINGEAETQSGTADYWNHSASTITVGGREENAAMWNGNISDFRIYSTALSADDIKELYNTSAYVLDNGTLLTYNLEE